MIRVVGDPLVHNAVLIGLFHPLNQYCRQSLLNNIALKVQLPTSISNDTLNKQVGAEQKIVNQVSQDIAIGESETFQTDLAQSIELLDSSSADISPGILADAESSLHITPVHNSSVVGASALSTIATNKLDKFDQNLYRSLLVDSIDKNNMKMTTISLYILHLLCTELITIAAKSEDFSVPSSLTSDLNHEIVSNQNSTAHELAFGSYSNAEMTLWRMHKCFISKPIDAIKLLESLFVLPNDIVISNEERDLLLSASSFRKTETEVTSKLTSKLGSFVESVTFKLGYDAFDYDPELLSLPLVVEIGQTIKEKATEECSLTVVPYIQHLFQVLKSATEFSLANVQVLKSI